MTSIPTTTRTEEGDDLEYEEDPDAVYEEDEEEQDDGQDDEEGHEGQTQHSKNVGFNKMEPDDGMEWDGQEAERVQQQHQDAARAAAAAVSQDQQRRLAQQQAGDVQQQQGISHPYAQQQSAPGYAGPSQGPSSQAQQWASGSEGSEQSHYQQQASSQAPRQQQYAGQGQPNGDAQMYANGRSSTSSLQSGPSYGALQPNHRVPGEHVRTVSGERSISSINSNASIYDASGRPISIAMSRNSTSSSNGFLPSQIQRERANSDASANSTVIAGESSTSSSDKDKRKSSRSSKGNDSLDAADEKAGKKRSGVFSLFSRKDKKDRKSGNFEERDNMAGGISSEDSYSSYARGRGSPAANAAPVNPAVHAANAGLQPGQSIGMGRAVQERDRATQEAYQRQFLSPQASSFDSHMMSPSASDDKKRINQRPGSLIGPSGSTPMLSVLRVFAGEGVDSDSTFKTVLLNDSTRSIDLQRQALQRFGVNLHDMDNYVLTIKRLEGDERPLDEDEHPLKLFNTLTEILQQGQVTVPSVKRSSVGSISSINSNLSTHPAIARLGNDFSDDHAVKFYISRRDRLQGYVDLNGSHTADESARSVNVSDLSTSQENSNVTSLSMGSQDAASVLTGETSETVQSPTARFALRLIIYAADLPEGIVFDPQSNALIPAATLRERMTRSDSAQDAASQHRFREKILTFPRNTTVAEVVEEGLDRFGISEGVVEGGDDVEDRPSRRKSKLHVKYGLAVQAADGERALATTSKVLEAYPTPPTFKLGIGNRKTSDGKRRSIDAAALLGASDDVGVNDPVFVLRQITHVHSGPKNRLGPNRALSPTDNVLAAAQGARASQLSPATSPRIGTSKDLAQAKPNQGMTPQEIIAAQRAAAAERNAAVLGAQRNTQQGVDVMLSNQARIRSSKLGPSNKFRYSYVPADGQERDISSIIEEVMKDQMHSSLDSQSSANTGLSSRDARPNFTAKKSMQSDFTVDDYASALSDTGAESPLSLDEVNFEVKSPSSEIPGVAPLAFGRQQKTTTDAGKVAVGAADGDLLDNLLRGGPAQSNAAVEERINAVLNRVQTPSEAASATRSAPSAAVAPNGQANQPAATTAAAHKKQTSTGSEFSNSRDTSSPLTVGTSSLGTHATNTTGTMLTPLSTFVSQGNNGGIAGRTIANDMRSASAPVGNGTGRTSVSVASRSVTPSAYPSYAALSFGADDASLSHLYTIVEAAARRDPRRARLLTHASMSSISSSTSPVLNTSALMGSSSVAGSRPGSKLSNVTTNSKLALLLEDEKDALKPEPGGLFAPPMPFVEDKKLREAYSGINRELGDIDDSLDSLLADVIRLF